MDIDLNSDLGEDFGYWRSSRDELVIPRVTSANIACGFHAGDPMVIDRAVGLCKKHNVAVGAHVSYPDLIGFGRRDMDMASDELEASVIYQAGAVAAFCSAHGMIMNHVKPHGALYNRAATDPLAARAIAQAIVRLDPGLLVFAQPGSALAQASTAAGLTVINEGFCDRAYRLDGTLVPRSERGAVIEDPDAAAERAVGMALRGEVETQHGVLRQSFATLCLHGDNPAAVASAQTISAALRAAGVSLRAPSRTI